MTATTHLPPGPDRLSLDDSARMARNPLPLLLAAYENYGPVFTVRVLGGPQVFALGPEATHRMLVGNAGNYVWRAGEMSDLVPLLGDGLLTIDGPAHRRMRRLVLPAFHRESIAAMAATVAEEAERAVAGWRPGETVDVHGWARTVAMRIAMRALLGLDPDDGDTGGRAAREFERALAFYGTDRLARRSHEPGSPLRRFEAAREALDRIVYAQIARRRRAGDGRGDILAMLLGARDDDGRALDDREIRDQLLTLMFAGHDTTASTISFLLYELARNPEERALLQAVADRAPGAAPGLAGTANRLEDAIDETLRLYPPAWVGPRLALAEDTLAGVRVPAGARVNYCSWATHRLPDLWSEPDRFDPARFADERAAALPKGAYVPFGGGSRTCVGMRFAHLEIRALATAILGRCTPELQSDHQMTVRPMPTLRPEGALHMTVRPRQ
ncbi:MAG: cytochrome P450 [Solirubrobacterales bacterium]|nr:cytochrome P450 [Solirubrobacterales bacterium]